MAGARSAACRTITHCGRYSSALLPSTRSRSAISATRSIEQSGECPHRAVGRRSAIFIFDDARRPAGLDGNSAAHGRKRKERPLGRELVHDFHKTLARDLLFAISRQYRADIGASKRNALRRPAHKRKSVALIEGRSGTWLRSQRARGSTAFEVVPIKIALSDSVLGPFG